MLFYPHLAMRALNTAVPVNNHKHELSGFISPLRSFMSHNTHRVLNLLFTSVEKYSNVSFYEQDTHRFAVLGNSHAQNRGHSWNPEVFKGTCYYLCCRR